MSNTITKSRINKVYRGYKLLNCTYHSTTWITNTYIAENNDSGTITPRVYKDMLDYREMADKMPALETIIDSVYTPEMIVSITASEYPVSVVTTANYSYDYNTDYISYLVDKYGQENLLLEPLGRTSKLFASDDDGQVRAVLMGLRS